MRWLVLAMPLCSCTIPVDQRAACAEWVACIDAKDAADGVSTDLDRYRPDGDCWGGDEIADLCERSCDNGLAWLRSHEAELPEVCR